MALRFCRPDGSRIYPVGTDKMPAGVQATTTGWQITAAEKERTGIQEFSITGAANPRQFAFKLIDTQTSLRYRITAASSSSLRSATTPAAWR